MEENIPITQDKPRLNLVDSKIHHLDQLEMSELTSKERISSFRDFHSIYLQVDVADLDMVERLMLQLPMID